MYRTGKFYVKLAVPDGTTFPTHTSIETGSLFYRNDERLLYVYSGEWLALPTYSGTPNVGDALRWDGQFWVLSGVAGGGGGPGATSFTNLTDTPSNYTGSGGYTVTVKDDQTGLEFSESVTGETTYKVLLYSTTLTEYDATDAGMASAIAAATDGDTIKVPPVTLSNEYTIPSGVTVVGGSISDVVFNGQITLNTNSTLELLTVDVDVSSSGIHFGVLGPLVGSGYVKYCWIDCVNTIGSGYGVGARDGTLHVYGGRVYGSTADVIESWSE